MTAPRSDGLRFLFALDQPPITADRRQRVRRLLIAYRVMAFVTGVVLIAGTGTLILKYVTSLHLEPGVSYLWVAHGYLYLVYLIIAIFLGFRLRWPIPRLVLVLLAGTIPTASFFAEHFVTKAVRANTVADTAPAEEPSPARD